jgi:hypothetical protein
VALVLVGWIGFSVYSGVAGTSETVETEKETYTVDTSAIDDFFSGLSEE